MTDPDYKSLLIKYVNHVKFHEGIDYLSEGRAADSKELSEVEIMEIQAIVSAKATSDATLDRYFSSEQGQEKIKELRDYLNDTLVGKIATP